MAPLKGPGEARKYDGKASIISTFRDRAIAS